MSTAHEVQIPQWTRGDRLRKSLESKGFSVNEAAVRFRVSRNTVTNWIHDKTTPPPVVVEVWASWSGVPLAWLETGEPGPGEPGPGLTLLPQVDSNDQPFDYQFRRAAPFLAAA